MMGAFDASFAYVGFFLSGVVAHWWQTPARAPRGVPAEHSFDGLAAECLDRLERLEPTRIGWLSIVLIALAFIAGASVAASGSRLLARWAPGGAPSAPTAAASIVFHQAVTDVPVQAPTAPAAATQGPVDYSHLDLDSYVPVGRRPISSCL